MAKRILLADDSLTIQKVVELTFSDADYDLVCVPNGQRALEKVAESAPDLILADVVMPEKNGYEVCEAIKANPATAGIPVILLSGTFEPFDRDRAERLGCDAIVSKPFDSQQLLRQVEALLARAPQDAPSASTLAIALPAPAPAPPPAAASPERAPAEAGFASEDFTGSIPRPAEIAGGPDLFEEEYGQADVESAIAAFEKAHPEFSYVEDVAATAAMTPEHGAEVGAPADAGSTNGSGEAIRGDVVDLLRAHHTRARSRGRGCLFVFVVVDEAGRAAHNGRDDAQKKRLARFDKLHFDAQVADLDDVALRKARHFDRLAIDVGAGDAALVGDRVAAAFELDHRMLERDRRVLGAQLGIRAAADAQGGVPHLCQGVPTSGDALNDEADLPFRYHGSLP